jgi:HTH-type transcriptional repressor of NAD biosynthesis genes
MTPAHPWPGAAPFRVRRLCLLGGESAGKTTLALALAERLRAPFVAEYGRELWLRIGGTFDEALLLEVAREQVRREEAAVAQAAPSAGTPSPDAQSAWVVCDTSALTTLVYSLIDHGHALPELHTLAQRPYDLIVLCTLDFGFVQDGARRDEGFSAQQQALTEQLLREFELPWVEVSGSVEQRVDAVLRQLER